MMKRTALWAMAMGIAVCAMGAAQAAPPLGEAPPDYLGRTLGGEEVRLSDRRGKVVMVSFWASWCGYCRKQFPMLDAFQRVFPSEQLEVIVVNFKEPARDYRAVVRQLRSSPVTWTHDANGAISDAYGVDAVPRLFVIDKYGDLAHSQMGYSETALTRLEGLVRELVADQGPVAIHREQGAGPAVAVE